MKQNLGGAKVIRYSEAFKLEVVRELESSGLAFGEVRRKYGIRGAWTVQYWDGSAFVDVPGASAYPIADDTFNHVSFGSVTTTKLRVVLQSGLGSVGVIQWVVPSIPAN